MEDRVGGSEEEGAEPLDLQGHAPECYGAPLC